MTVKITEKERRNFWKKVDKRGDCWIWTAAKTGGYGRFSLGGKIRMAQRVAWLLANDGKEIPHNRRAQSTCGKKDCVRPDHLRLIPGRKAKLTEADVLAGRETVSGLKYGERVAYMKKEAARLGVTYQAYSRAIHGQSWGHLPGAVGSGILTDKQVLEIRKTLSELVQGGAGRHRVHKFYLEWAEKCGVCWTTIYNAARGQTFQHLPLENAAKVGGLLTYEQVEFIRKERGRIIAENNGVIPRDGSLPRLYRRLAEKYGVAESTIAKAATGMTYKGV